MPLLLCTSSVPLSTFLYRRFSIFTPALRRVPKKDNEAAASSLTTARRRGRSIFVQSVGCANVLPLTPEWSSASGARARMLISAGDRLQAAYAAS